MEYVFIWVFFGIVAAAIASGKGRSGVGWGCLGVLLGPFSLAVAFLPSVDDQERAVAQATGVSDGYLRCPFCAEVVRSEAVLCRFCRSELAAADPVSTGPAKSYSVVRVEFNGDETILETLPSQEVAERWLEFYEKQDPHLSFRLRPNR